MPQVKSSITHVLCNTNSTCDRWITPRILTQPPMCSLICETEHQILVISDAYMWRERAANMRSLITVTSRLGCRMITKGKSLPNESSFRWNNNTTNFFFLFFFFSNKLNTTELLHVQRRARRSLAWNLGSPSGTLDSSPTGSPGGRYLSRKLLEACTPALSPACLESRGVCLFRKSWGIHTSLEKLLGGVTPPGFPLPTNFPNFGTYDNCVAFCQNLYLIRRVY